MIKYEKPIKRDIPLVGMSLNHAFFLGRSILRNWNNPPLTSSLLMLGGNHILVFLPCCFVRNLIMYFYFFYVSASFVSKWNGWIECSEFPVDTKCPLILLLPFLFSDLSLGLSFLQGVYRSLVILCCMIST